MNRMTRTKRHRPWAAWLIAILIAAGLNVAVATPAAAATPNFQMPFPCGETWHASTYDKAHGATTNHSPSVYSTDWNLIGAQDHYKPVLAGVYGKATVKPEQYPGFGKYVEVAVTGTNWVTRYAHLDAVSVANGANVNPQTQIGTVGATGLGTGSTAYHLHYDQIEGGVVRPVSFNGTAINYVYQYTTPNPYTSTNCATPTGGGLRPFIGDFNGDNLDDLALRDSATGTLSYRYNLGNLSFGSAATGSWAAGTNYQPFAGDFNADNRDDLGLKDAGNGIWYLRYNFGNLNFGSNAEIGWTAGATQQAFVGDFNADNLDDLALRDSATGALSYRYNLNNLSFGSTATGSWAAGANYEVFAGDFNGDNLDDLGLRDAGNGIWYLRYNLGNLNFGSNAEIGWTAGANQQPFVGDFNGDNRDDIGLRDTNTGIMSIRYNLSATGSLSFGSAAQIGWTAG